MDVLMPDGTTITGVPDGITKAQLMAKYGAAKPDAAAPQVPGLSEGLDALSGVPRQVGLTARAALGGLGGVANMFLDPAVAGINSVTGSNIPIPSQAMERTLSRFLPTPANATERIAQAGARAMVPVAGTVGLGRAIPALAPLAVSPGTQALSAASGGAASQGAAEAGASPWIQLGAGLAGGLAGPSAFLASKAAATAALRVPGSLIAPFTKSGQMDAAARIFQNAASNPSAALDALGGPVVPKGQALTPRQQLGYDLGPRPNFQLVPGSTPTTAEVAADNGLSGLHKTLFSNPQTRPPLEDVAQSNDAARRAFLAQKFGNPASITAAQDARDAVTTPMREDAFANAGPVDVAPVVAQGNKTLAAGAQYRGNGPMLTRFVNDISGISDPQVLYNGPRKAISDALNGKLARDDPLSQLTRGELISLRGVIDDQIESVAPGFKKYLETHANLSRPIDAMELGQNIAERSTNPRTDQLSPTTFARQVQSNAKDIARSGAQASDALTRVNEDLRRSAAPFDAVRAPGSDTVPNSAASDALQKMLGYVPGGVATRIATKGIGLLMGTPEDQIRNLVVRGAVSPEFAAQLLGRKPYLRPDLMRGLLAQRLPVAYGGLLGATSGQQGLGQ
jgi:hypothetical protein